MFKLPLCVLLLFLLAFSSALADAPNTMNYQGLLTDGDSAVANGGYSVVFTIYDAPALGNSKWTETRVVTTVSGLFTVVLGTVTPIDDTVFNGTGRWLGVKVEADAEMTPRTALATVPYAARIATVDGASGGTITGATVVTGNDGGNQLSVTNTGLGRGGFFQISNGANTEAAVQGTHVGAGPGGSFFSDGGGPGIVASATGGTAADFQGRVQVGGDIDVDFGLDSVLQADASLNILRNWGADGNGENWRLWGASFGQLLLHGTGVSNSIMAEVSGAASGGEIELHDATGADYIKLDGGETGDNSAVLAVGAVNSQETSNETGLSSNSSSSDNISSTVTVVLRTITCPAAGYVLATGTGYLETSHSMGGYSNSQMWLSDSTGYWFAEPVVEFRVSGNAPSGGYEAPYAIQEVFPVSAGPKTIYLRGSSNVLTNAHNNVLTLVYIPTAYGTIASSEVAEMGGRPAEGAQDVRAEQAEAKQFDVERIQKEIALQQDQLAKLAQQVEQLQTVADSPADE